MGFLDGLTGSGGNVDPTQNAGLMGMYANPQTAGMLGLAQGLLASSGPSRIPVSMGQAMGYGLQGAQQGFGNALQMQMEMQKMRAMMDPFGTGFGGVGQAQAQRPNPTLAQGSPVLGATNTAPMSGVSAGLGSLAPQMPIQQQPSSPNGLAIFGGHTPQEVMLAGARLSALGNPAGAEMMKLAGQADPTLNPTDATRMAVQGGLTPQQAQQANVTALAKANAPVSLRSPIFWDPATGTAQAVPANVLQAGYGAQYGAQQQAKAQNENQQVWDPTANNGAGGMVFRTTAQINNASNGSNGAPGPAPTLNGIFAQQESSNGKTAPDNPYQIQQGTFNQYAKPGESWTNTNDRSAVAQRVLAGYSQKYGGDLGRIATAYFSGEGNVAPAGSPTPFIKNTSDSNGKSVASYVGDILGRAGGSGFGAAGATPTGSSGPMAAQAPYGSQTFAQGQVKQMQDRFGTLRDQNAAAQTVISQLQNIASLAPAAITGAEADRRAYMNGLLSLVGVPGAQDAKTATDLLDKYSNQIIAKLGQGGLGTDAARTIVSAGNPNAHMTVPAIQEAVRNLTGQYQMVQAKTALLQRFANGNDPGGYTKTETAFDQNADPRIWEWQAIQDPAQRQQFAAGVLKQDPKFAQKIQSLEKLGALQ